MDVFHYDSSKENFETFGKENGVRYWFARDLMSFLEYSSYNSFKQIINRAHSACLTLEIEISENFIQTKREIDGVLQDDFKLTRFACYLIAMNADPKKEPVAQAQLYFIQMAEVIRNHILESENMERILIREDISNRETSLSGVAKSHGVQNYPLFQNAGYRGLYNKNINDLKKIKGLSDIKRSLLDFMGKEELAANLFRITQTESKIKNENIQGQENLENAAEKVGNEVRKVMINTSGNRPEHLPLSDDIKSVKKEIKNTHKKLKKIDKLNSN